MSKILGISGKKQSGKNTAANYINGITLKRLHLAKDFYVDDSGHLIILTDDSSGKEGWGEFDLTRHDDTFVQFAEHNVWPYVKMYSFADGLKRLCVEFFGLQPEQVYGTDKQKNTDTCIMWKDMPCAKNDQWIINRGKGISSRIDKYMTARELMQFFGTNIMRQMHEPVHVNHAISRILAEQSELAIVPDVRFPNEVEAIQKAGGKVIRLTRNTRKDSHASECGLDPDKFDWNKFDAVIENDGSIQETLDSVDAAYQTIFLP